MVSSCCALGCYERHTKGTNTSFHRFPRSPELNKKWILALKRENFTPNTASRICGKHFTKEDFKHTFGKPTLVKDAVPSVFNFSETSKEKRKNRKSLQADYENNPEPSKSVNIKEEFIVEDPLDVSHDTINEPDKVILEHLKQEDPLDISDVAINEPDMISSEDIKLEDPLGDDYITINEPDLIVSKNLKEKNVVSLESRSIQTNYENNPGPSKSINIKEEFIVEDPLDVSHYSINEPGKVILEHLKQEDPLDIIDVAINEHNMISSEDIKLEDPLGDDYITINEPNLSISENLKEKKVVSLGSRSVQTNCESNPGPSKSDFIQEQFMLEDSLYVSYDAINEPNQVIHMHKKNGRQPTYFGDFRDDDLNDPVVVEKMWKVAKQTVEKQKKAIKYLRNQNYRLKKRVKTLTDNIAHLKNANSNNSLL